VSAGWESLVPEALHDTVREALAATYGGASVECLGPVTGGAWARSRCALPAAGGITCYAPRRGAARCATRTSMPAWPRLQCRRRAPLHTVDAERGVAVMEMVEACRSSGSQAVIWRAPRALADLARRLQATETFPCSATGE
jgi:hypothetical protein